MNKKALIAVLAGSIMASGCAVRVADMTVGSTKNYDINSQSFVKGSRVEGEDLAPVVLFPLGIPNVKTAIDDAIEKDRCAVGLSDLVITQLNQAFLIGRIGYRVEGDLILDQGQPGCKNAR
jgi:hypothetical protein